MKIFYTLILICIPFFLIAQPGSESGITPINSTIGYQGFDETVSHFGTAEYNIYYDNVDGILDKPIFFIDGFDPSDTRTIPLIYDLLDVGTTGDNLGDLVRDEGYDLVILNFPNYVRASDGANINGGADYIQRNALILVELLNIINGLKVGAEENVVIGPSMGGLISRYALKYMEDSMLDHDTRLYISFDSPHRGANVPIGIQYLFNYMANGDPGITDVEPLVGGLLNSAAAKQMLIDHYLGHIDTDGFTQTGSNLQVGAPGFRDAFQSELDAMGFPQDTRNISVSNGSALGVMTGTPGMELINHTFDTGVQSGFDTRAIVKTNFVPRDVGTITVTDFVGQAGIAAINFWNNVFTYDAVAESTSATNGSGIDSAPGGQFDLFSFNDDTNPLITEFVNNLNSQYFNFIPTLSALAITETDDWYALPDVSTRFSTPFDATYIPDDNQPHVQVNSLNVAFALNEIMNPGLSNDDSIAESFRIAKNPINDDVLTILSSKTYNNVMITIVDITGKVVFSKQNQSLSNRTNISLNLDSGLYILNIAVGNGLGYNTKIIMY